MSRFVENGGLDLLRIDSCPPARRSPAGPWDSVRCVRGPRLPDVFSARGRARAPRPGWRPRVGLTLFALCIVASATAAATIGALLCAWYVVTDLVSGRPAEAWVSLAALAGNAFLAAVGQRVTVAVVAWWLAEDDPQASPD